MAHPSEPESVSDGLAAALEPRLGTVAIEDLERLSGGASRETWAFRAAGRDLILRRDPPGRPGLPGSMALEARAIAAAHGAGLAAPEVLLHDDGTLLGTAGLVMERIPGETIARRILRDDVFASARGLLAGQIGEFLGGLHSLSPDEVPGLPAVDPLEQYWAAYRLVDDTSATFEVTFEWLAAHRPTSPARPAIVHGDLRLGNLVVDSSGLRAVIDWELVHVGDPLEDLAWVCTKAWRFGSGLPVAGVGELEEMFGGYSSVTGQPVDRDAFRWWLVLGTLKWGVICMGQAAAHLSGLVQSVELAAIGRRVAEQEWDLIELLAPDEWASARNGPQSPARDSGLPPARDSAQAPDGSEFVRNNPSIPDVPSLYGRPTARELLAAVRQFLTDEVMPGTAGRLSFQARVAANVVAIVERELAAGPIPPPSGRDWASLAAAVRQKLAVANPRHLQD